MVITVVDDDDGGGPDGDEFGDPEEGCEDEQGYGADFYGVEVQAHGVEGDEEHAGADDEDGEDFQDAVDAGASHGAGWRMVCGAEEKTECLLSCNPSMGMQGVQVYFCARCVRRPRVRLTGEG